MSTTHIMVDLETWGTTPGCDIRSIGAVVFDPIIRTLGDEFYINLDNPKGRWRNGVFCPELAKYDHERMYPLFREPDTVAWWADQSAAAQQRLTSDPVDLAAGLRKFAQWWNVHQGEDTTFWAYGPHFDEAILAAAYRAVDLPVPWHYRAPRDCRTAFDLAGDPCRVDFVGVEHDALDDAKNQARRVIKAYRLLGHGRTYHHLGAEAEA